MTHFVLIRHGQTAWNRVERFRGRADVPLDATGIAQAELTGRRVASSWPPQAIYASPLSRATTTAEAIARRCALPVQIHSGLVDIDYGDWQGLAPGEVQTRWPTELHAWYHAPEHAVIPGGETLTNCRTRGMAVLTDLAIRHAQETVVLVSHTVINRVILLGVLGLPNARFWRLRQDTCAINVFDTVEDDFIVVSLNDTCHLREIGQ